MRRWGIGAAAVLLAVSAPVARVAAAEAPTHVAVGSPASRSCPTWHMHTVAKHLGILESLLPDNRGGMLLSSTTNNAVERLTPSGKVTTVVSAPSPGQLVWLGHRVLFPTGDDFASGAESKADGTLQLLNPKTHKLVQYANGLTMPNGLARGRNGDAYVTRDLGTGTGITRISAGKGHRVRTDWSTLSDTNGIAISANNKTMYVDRTFVTNAPIVAIPLAHPKKLTQIGDLSTLGSAEPKGLDDLIMGPHGVLYLPANLSGEIFSFNPTTHQACLVASGLGDPSAITFGTGHGWRKGAMFVCGFDGKVRELVRSSTS